MTTTVSYDRLKRRGLRQAAVWLCSTASAIALLCAVSFYVAESSLSASTTGTTMAPHMPAPQASGNLSENSEGYPVTYTQGGGDPVHQDEFGEPLSDQDAIYKARYGEGAAVSIDVFLKHQVKTPGVFTLSTMAAEDGNHFVGKISGVNPRYEIELQGTIALSAWVEDYVYTEDTMYRAWSDGLGEIRYRSHSNPNPWNLLASTPHGEYPNDPPPPAHPHPNGSYPSEALHLVQQARIEQEMKEEHAVNKDLTFAYTATLTTEHTAVSSAGELELKYLLKGTVRSEMSRGEIKACARATGTFEGKIEQRNDSQVEPLKTWDLATGQSS
jgi:hypothetical protein